MIPVEAIGEFGKSVGRCKQVKNHYIPCTQFQSDNSTVGGYSSLALGCEARKFVRNVLQITTDT